MRERLLISLKTSAFRRLLARRSQSLRTFAHAAGVNPPYLCEIVQGHRPPGPRIRAKLLTALGVPFATLFAIPKLTNGAAARRAVGSGRGVTRPRARATATG